jgi:cytochrome c
MRKTLSEESATFRDHALAAESMIAAAIRWRLTMRRCLAIVLLWVVWPAWTADAVELSPRAQRGFTFSRTNCSSCHSIDKVSPSPMKSAPAFRTLHTRYPVETLEEALAEGILTGHPNMPEFRLDPAQIGDLIAFLRTLEE